MYVFNVLVCVAWVFLCLCVLCVNDNVMLYGAFVCVLSVVCVCVCLCVCVLYLWLMV